MENEKRIKVIDWLNAIEKKYDVTALKVDDLHYWPVLRWALAKKFIEYEKKSASGKKNSFIIQIQKIKNYILGGFYLFLLKFKLIRNYDIIFTAADSYYSTYENKKINRLFFPITNILKEKRYRILTADYSGYNFTEPNNIPLNFVYNFYNKINKGKCFKITDPIYEEIIKDYEVDFNVKFDKVNFQRKINDIFKWEKIYAYLIKACKPGWIFSICYYSVQVYGLNLACYRRNVKSLDLQHGPQGKLHPAYSGFSNIPSKGFSSLPKVFWCWDSASTENLENIFKHSKFHTVFKGGHPWVSYLTTNLPDKKIIISKNVLLFSLQPLKPILPDIILKAFDNTPEGYVWWVRTHPRMKEPDRKYLEKTLNPYVKKGIVEMDKASRIPLPEVLALSNIHLTRSSGCFMEANMMGVPNIIIDEIGVLYYKELIDGEMNYAQTSGNVWPLIQKLVKIPSGKDYTESLKANLLDLLKTKRFNIS